jgi:hypothetical protein
MSKQPKVPVLFNRNAKKDKMPYTLITSKGKVMQFYVLAVAVMFQELEGGKIVTEDILVDTLQEQIV